MKPGLCVKHNKVSHTGLKQHKGQEIKTEFSFLGDLYLDVKCFVFLLKRWCMVYDFELQLI